jgi:FkbM family methyltransferase
VTRFVWAAWRAVPGPLKQPLHALVALGRRLRAHGTPSPAGPAPPLPPNTVDLRTLHGSFWFDGTDEKVVPWIRRHATWEADVVRFLEHTVQPGWTAVDVGANVGFHTVVLSQLVGPGGAVHAFEPLPETVELLRANLWRHRCANTTVHAVAASDHAGEVHLQPDPEGASGAQLADSGIAATAVTLDDALPPGPIDLLKVDVEGTEPLVFRGAAATIAKSPHLVAVVEFRDEVHADGSAPEQVLALYRELGFDLCLLAPSGIATRAADAEIFAAARRLGTINIVLRRSAGEDAVPNTG